MTNNTPHKLFLKGLHRKNLNVYDIIETYICVGTDGFSRAYNDKVLWNKCGIEYFKKCYPEHDFLPYSKQCICGVNIKENCYITSPDMDYNNIIIVGNCCYTKFIDNNFTDCLICKNKHTNGITRNQGRCDNCKKIIKNIEQEYRKTMPDISDELNNITQAYNCIKLLNIAHNKDCNIKFKTIECTLYSIPLYIANMYKNNTLVASINCKYMKPTKLCPSLRN